MIGGKHYMHGEMLPDRTDKAPIELAPRRTYLTSRKAVQDYIDENNFDDEQEQEIWLQYEEMGEVEI